MRLNKESTLALGLVGSLLVAGGTASAAVIAQDNFDGYEGTITAETTPAAGSPFSDFSLVSIVRDGTIEVRNGNLDGSDGGRHLALTAAGRDHETAAAQRISRSMVGGTLDLAKFTDFLTDDGLIGKDGTSLYFGFTMRAAGAYAGDPQFEAGLQINDPEDMNAENFVIGKHWAPGRETHYHIGTAAGRLGELDAPGEEQVHTFLFKIEFNESGNETISAWFNPTPDSEAMPRVTVELDLPAFDSIRFRTSQNYAGNAALVEIDDFTIGTSFDSVIPEPGSLSVAGLAALLLGRRRRQS